MQTDIFDNALAHLNNNIDAGNDLTKVYGVTWDDAVTNKSKAGFEWQVAAVLYHLDINMRAWIEKDPAERESSDDQDVYDA